MLDQLELDWLLLGLRLGQLTDVVRPVYLRDDDDPPLVVQLLSKLRSALRRCETVPKDQERLLRIASQMEATWEQRDAPMPELGTERPFELIYRDLLQLTQSLPDEADVARYRNCFDVGSLLGQSSGWCGAYFDGFGEEETCWSYRNRQGLDAGLRSLGTTLESISGLPETEDAKNILSFLCHLPVDAPIMRRYPYRRWGWGFIEDRLDALASEQLRHLPLIPASVNEHDAKQRPSSPPQQQDSPAQQEQAAVAAPEGATASPIKPGYLDLVVDINDKRVPIRRAGFEAQAELAEDRLWQLFLKYYEAAELFVTKKELKKAWSSIGTDPDPSNNFANAANSDLRKKLKILNVTVALKMKTPEEESAWRLEDLTPKVADDDE